METIREINNDAKKSYNKVLAEKRRKHLINKLHKIKRNKSIADSSFMDLHSYYESKYRKLRNNNSSLAKALAEQRHIAQAWYDEYIIVKAAHQDTQARLLRYQVRETNNFDVALENELENHWREILEPLKILLKTSMADVLKVASGMDNMQQLINRSTTKPERTVGLLSRNSEVSVGSRPPLSKSPRSPRKNVVHPMVEGHVLQPATITLPRVSLEDQYKYRVQERVERRERDQEPNLSNILEQSPNLTVSVLRNPDSVEEEENSMASENATTLSEAVLTDVGRLCNVVVKSSDSDVDEDGTAAAVENVMASVTTNKGNISTTDEKETTEASPPNNETCPEELANIPCKVEISSTLSSETERKNVPAECKSSRRRKKKEKEGGPNEEPATAQVDPLEGPSWLYGSKANGKKRKQSRAPYVRSTSVRLVLENSSDTDDEEDHRQQKPRLSLSCGSSTVCLSPSKRKRSVELKDVTSNVSRRSKKKLNTRKTDAAHNDDSVPRMLESFIINETLSKEVENSVPSSKDSLNDSHQANGPNVLPLNSPNNTHHCLSVTQLVINNTNNPCLIHEKEDPRLLNNITFFPNTSMEMTECFSKDLLNTLNQCGSTDTVVECEAIQKNINGECCSDREVNKDSCTVSKIGQDNSNDSSMAEKNRACPKPVCEKFESGSEDLKIKPKRFFKRTEMEKSGDSNNQTKLPVKTPFDVSQIETSVVGEPYLTLTTEKENIPPDVVINSITTIEDALKLRSISIVCEDIMKSPMISDTTKVAATDSKLGNWKRKIPINNSCSNSAPSGPHRSKDCYKIKDERSSTSSPLRKGQKKKKLLNFSCDHEEAVSDEDWFPCGAKNKSKNKTKPKKVVSKTTKSLVVESAHTNSDSFGLNASSVSSGSGHLARHSEGISAGSRKRCVSTGKRLSELQVIMKIKEAKRRSEYFDQADVNNYSVSQSRRSCDNLNNEPWQSPPTCPSTEFEGFANEVTDYGSQFKKEGIVIYNEAPLIDLVDVPDEVDPLIVNLEDKDQLMKDTTEQDLGIQLYSRTRRAAAKIASFKEPSLICKMRRDSGKRTKKRR